VKKSIFISKSLTDLPVLSAFCAANNCSLFAQSLIQFFPIKATISSTFDVVFFSSIRAASFFLEQHQLPENCQIACIGETTAKKINALGFGVSFIGENAGNPLHVAEIFKMWLGERRVLFPLSNVSKRTIVEQIPPHQRCEVTIYETRALPLIIEESDWLVFTSPSNVESYFSLNTLNESKIIAWGSTTEKALKEKGYSVEYTLSEANEKNLVAYFNEKLVL
jgi:uroporphyrinogen-III synthase